MEMDEPIGMMGRHDEPSHGPGEQPLVLGPTELQEEMDSLRRVVEAYANYPRAAEATVLRWEQSFQWLPKAHKGASVLAQLPSKVYSGKEIGIPPKELLKHLPEKYKEARRCIAANAMFISAMLQDFDPPFPLPPDTLHRDNHHHAHHHDATEEQQSHHGPTWQRDSGAGSRPHSVLCGQEHQGAAPTFPAHATSGPGPGPEADSNGQAQALGGHSAASVVLPPPWLRINRERVVPPADADKVRCMLRSIVREWTADGAQERREAFDPILNELRRKFKHRLRPVDAPPVSRPDEKPSSADGQVDNAPVPEATLEHSERGGGPGTPPTSLVPGSGVALSEAGEAVGMPPTCLVPGAGLGRLALEICRQGFSCQGNEFSFYTLICSSFILNCCAAPAQWTLFPWVLSSCNSLSDADQLRAVGVPDDLPSIPLAEDGATPLVEFSMCAGDFVEVYRHPSQKGTWDSVATCFFIDTAHNVVEYLEVIWQVLRPGGVWVNLGPLLYHFADSAGPMLYPGAANEEEARKRAEMSLEISLEDVKRVACSIGFVLEKEEFVETTYSANPTSMMRTQYTCVLWTMIKPNS